ncbi:large ribosomal subunit protein bL28 [Maricaulis salignorans]|uniref:large ribosomal subunit protein bL28 n=1 Tax=Maricaulis salignorans TaxID=144026 RepID=UPI003A8EFFEE
MSGRCNLCGRGTVGGNNVSKSNKKTKRTFQVNNSPGTIRSECLNECIRLARICSKCTRTIDHVGGFDQYALKFLKNIKLNSIDRVIQFAKRAVKCKGRASLQPGNATR